MLHWNHWLRCITATESLQARRNTEAAAAAARKALLAGGDAAAAPGRAGQATAVATSQGITKSLLRTRQLMAQVRPLPPAALPSSQQYFSSNNTKHAFKSLFHPTLLACGPSALASPLSAFAHPHCQSSNRSFPISASFVLRRSWSTRARRWRRWTRPTIGWRRGARSCARTGGCSAAPAACCARCSPPPCWTQCPCTAASPSSSWSSPTFCRSARVPHAAVLHPFTLR